MNNKTLIINYPGLQIGGIEVAFSKLIQYSLEKGYRVIWLTSEGCVKKSDFKHITDNPKLEKVYVKRGYRWFPHKKIKFSFNEEVVMISCEPIDFARGESIKSYAKNVKSFNHYLILPHFTGNAYYPERYFKSKLAKKYWLKLTRSFAKKLIDNDSIRAFSSKHLEAYEKNYGFEIENKRGKVLKGMDIFDAFDENQARERALERKEKFKIVTCSRFDFPHKGYILGLIDEYAELKKAYSQIELTVVGYGDGESRIKEKINSLPVDIARDIELTGALLPEELKKCYEKCHLNIGLAGALVNGAICGVPSLLTRHYTEKCETYGYICNIEGTFLRTDEGHDIKKYIIDALNWSDNEYIEQGKKDYNKACMIKENDPEYIYNQKKQAKRAIIKGIEKSKWKLLNLLCFIKIRFFKSKGYEDNN